MAKTAVVFPGQGSQKVGMVSQLAEQFPLVKELYKRASAIIEADLWKMVDQGPVDLLNQTVYTQPAMLVADVAMWQIFKEANPNITVDWLAGHSLGEYAALVAAEAIDFSDAVKLVAHRAQYMQEAVPVGQGAMGVLLGLSVEQVNEICNAISTKDDPVIPANYNAPAQIVIAGTLKAVERALMLAQEQEGAKRAMKLPMSVPSHCPLMKTAADKLSTILENFSIQSPKIPVLQNADVASHQEPEAIKKALIQQLCSPVQWIETIQQLKAAGCFTVIECGPGKVLTGLNKRIDSEIKYVALDGLTDCRVG